MQILVTCATYALGKELGTEQAAREFSEQCAAPKPGALPAARLIARLRRSHSVALLHQASTTLPKLRSRAFDAAAAGVGSAALWLMVDDDVECDSHALERLISLAAQPTPRAVFLPCRVRGSAAEAWRINIVPDGELRLVVDGVSCRRILRGGCGCVVVNRPAIDAMQRRFIDDTWRDDDGEQRIALFEMIRQPGGEWLGEDYSFCERARMSGVELLALCEGVSAHDGLALKLSEV